MPAPSTATIFTRERVAADLAEHTGILLVRRNRSEQVKLHLASLDPGRTACRRYDHSNWLGVHPSLAPTTTDRVCEACAAAWDLEPEQVLVMFYEWKNAPR